MQETPNVDAETPNRGSPEPSRTVREPDVDDSAGARLSFRESVLKAAGHDPSGITATGKIVGGQADFAEFSKARADLNLSEQDAIAVVAEVTSQKRDGLVSSLRYFIPALRTLAGAQNAAPVLAVANGARASPQQFNLKDLLKKHAELKK